MKLRINSRLDNIDFKSEMAIKDDKEFKGAVDIIKSIILYEGDIHNTAFLVGGCVRDIVIGKEPHDYDIATNLVPSSVIDMAHDKAYKGVFLVGISFGTVNILHNDNMYEVTTFRKEQNYSDGRHPDTVEYATELKEDLLRRDFTINAMAASASIVNEKQGIADLSIIDYFGGLQDLKNKVLRCVGNPNERFMEDALRILRAIRFAIKYDLTIEEETFKAMIANKDRLNLISKERITEEFRKILTCGKPITPVFLKCAEIIEVIIPEISKCVGFDQNNKYHQHDVYEHMLNVVDNCKTDKFEIKMAALLHDIGKTDAYSEDDAGHGHFYGHPKISYDICVDMLPKRFRLSSEELEEILTLIEQHDRTVIVSTKSIKRALNALGEPVFRDWMILRQADIDDHINLKNDNKNFIVDTSLYLEPLADIVNSNQAFTLKALNINGNDIMKITNTKGGKHIGIILNTLLDEVIDEEISNEYSVLAIRAKEIWDAGIGGE